MRLRRSHHSLNARLSLARTAPQRGLNGHEAWDTVDAHSWLIVDHLPDETLRSGVSHQKL